MICDPCKEGGTGHGACDHPLTCPCKHGRIQVLQCEDRPELRRCKHQEVGFCNECWAGLNGVEPISQIVYVTPPAELGRNGVETIPIYANDQVIKMISPSA